MKDADKIITFLDLCGHEKYLKTTMYGLVGMSPDYSMIVVGSNMGVARMTKEHLGITLALKIPFFIVLTKVDLCPDNIMKSNLELLQKILKSPLIKKIPIVIRDHNDLIKLNKININNNLCPIFIVSNVTGFGIDLLTNYFSTLQKTTSHSI
jgi:GTPase